MSDISHAQLQALLSNRASTYAFLSRLFLVEADESLLEAIDSLVLDAQEDESGIQSSYRALKSYVHARHEGTLTELAVDYARLFLGAQRGDGAYPFESIYTSEGRLLMQEARDQVLALYRQEGLDRAQDFNDPEDHVGLEMEFMAFLCQKAQQALAEDNPEAALLILEKQQRFLHAHLLNWVPAFLQDVRRIARTSFYQAVADLTQHFLESETELLPGLMEMLKYSE